MSGYFATIGISYCDFEAKIVCFILDSGDLAGTLIGYYLATALACRLLILTAYTIFKSLLDCEYVRSTAKASSVNNKTWDEVLARFDIQNQCDIDLLPEQGATTHTRVEAHSSLMLSWTTRAILLVGCVAALGNLPLQSYLPNNSTGQFTLTLNKQISDSTSQVMIETSDLAAQRLEEVNYASISKTLLPTVIEAAATSLSSEETHELVLPKQPLATYGGHRSINTDSIWQTYTVKRYDNQSNIFRRIKQSVFFRN